MADELADAASEGGRERLGQTAIELLDHLVDKFGEDVKIGQVVVVAEVFRGDEDGYNGVEILSSDDRAWTVYGLLSVAANGQLGRLELDDPPDDP